MRVTVTVRDQDPDPPGAWKRRRRKRVASAIASVSVLIHRDSDFDGARRWAIVKMASTALSSMSMSPVPTLASVPSLATRHQPASDHRLLPA